MAELTQYFLFDYPVTPKYVRYIGLFAIVLWLSLLATFWLNFIIKVTSDCNVRIDCFLDGHKIPKFQKDCDSVVDNSSLMQLHCYEFQSDLVNGAGTAGGLLAITVTILYGQLSA